MTDAEKFIEHHTYLFECVSGGYTSRGTAEQSWDVLQEAHAASGGSLPVPAACTGPDGEMFYSWDAGRHHLEVEFEPGSEASWFYRDRESGDFWGEDQGMGEPVPERVVEKLRLFSGGRD